MTLTQYLDVPCEYCGAGLGEVCRTAGGRVAKFSHEPRWQAWWRKTETKTGVSP